MKKFIVVCLTALCFHTQTMAQRSTITLKVIETSDVHGYFFPWDYINRKPLKGTMARVSSYVGRMRAQYGDGVILLDNGDILQGQPTSYFYDYIRPDEENIAASIMNYMGYDAQNMGNHDIETGHPVFDKWMRELKAPTLGANVVDVGTGRPYLKPYVMLDKGGVRVAVVGLLTPAIPNWVSENLWSGLRFDEMVSSARYWMKHIQATEKPDVVIGIFHSGKEGGIQTDGYEEDASLRVAREVPGFDLILYGHDHTAHNDTVHNAEGRTVVCLDPSCHALLVGDAEIRLTMDKGKVRDRQVTGRLTDISEEPIDEDFMNHFKKQREAVAAFVGRKIGYFENDIYTRDCYFGSAAFTDFILNLQLQLTGADVAFNAPLSFDESIRKGAVYVSDMFNLYRYENQIYVMKLTGKEIKNYLEMSYALWTNTMTSPEDHIMLLNDGAKSDRQRFGFKNLAFNFDSAAGIDYEVDVTKPEGQKIRILRMSDGRPFDENAWYKVALNSYRGNGGGELLTKGAGIPRESLKSRILFQSEKDQRYYLMKEIERQGTLHPQANHNWKFVPEEWTKPAIERDRKLIFGR